VTHEGTPLAFGSFNHGNPRFFAAMQSFNGPDTATLRYSGLSEGSVTVIVEEEQSANEEQNHTTEVVGYMALWNPDQAGDEADTRVQSRPMPVGQAMIEYGNIVLTHETFHVDLENTFVSPVVILGALSYNGGDPSTVRVWNVDNRGFDCAIQEWAYLDGPHTTEDLSYMVVEAGHHVLPDGTTYDAQVVQAGANWQQVRFWGPVQDPVVFSTINSDDTNQPMVTRQKNVGQNGLEIVLQAETAVSVPGLETVGVLAISQGQGDNAMISTDDGANENM